MYEKVGAKTKRPRDIWIKRQTVGLTVGETDEQTYGRKERRINEQTGRWLSDKWMDEQRETGG